MTLYFLIPCHNHANTLGTVVRTLPRTVPGCASVHTLVVDAGSTDGSAEVARAAGADAVVRLPLPRGVVSACVEGMHRCLALGADLIVIIDAEGLYAPEAIPFLVEPIVEGRAEMVVGDRGRQARARSTWFMRNLYRLASGVVRRLGNTAVADPQCAFRALSREAAMRLSAGGQHTFAESVIRAGQLDLPMASVPVQLTGSPRSRPSATRFALRAAATILRVFMSYQPFKVFAVPGSLLGLGGLFIAARFLSAYLAGQGPGMVQSLILGGLLLSAGAFLILCGVLAELLSANRALEEDIRFRLMNLQHRARRLRPPTGGAL